MTAPRVIVTRPEPDGAAFARDAAAAGFRSILSPVIKIVNRDVPVDLQGTGALAFTSVNGVRAFESAAHANRRLPVFAVGRSTAAAAHAAGFSAIAAADGDVASLAAIILGAAKSCAFDGEVLHVCGGDRAGDLAALLEGNGVKARRSVLYDAKPVDSMTAEARDALRSTPPAEWVVFFSPRSAGAFFEQTRAADLADRLAGVNAACLSLAVAEAAATMRFAAIEVAAARSRRAMLALMSRA